MTWNHIQLYCKQTLPAIDLINLFDSAIGLMVRINVMVWSFLDLFWVGEQDYQLLPAGVTSIYVGDNGVARAWFDGNLIGGKTKWGSFSGRLDGEQLTRHGDYQVSFFVENIQTYFICRLPPDLKKTILLVF